MQSKHWDNENAVLFEKKNKCSFSNGLIANKKIAPKQLILSSRQILSILFSLINKALLAYKITAATFMKTRKQITGISNNTFAKVIFCDENLFRESKFLPH